MTANYMTTDQAAQLVEGQLVTMLCGGTGENDDCEQGAFEAGARAQVYDTWTDAKGLHVGVVILAEGPSAGISNIFETDDFGGRFPFALVDAT